MVLASHQPDFFPYMGYFYKVFKSDVFVFSDNVQYSKSGRHNYNEILTAGGARKFTLPIHYKMANLNEIGIAADTRTIEKLVRTLWHEYVKAEHFHETFPVIEELFYLIPKAKNLAEWNEWCLYELFSKFGLSDNRRIYISSQLDIKNRRDARIIELCQMFGCDTYYSGVGAKDYHIEQEYREAGIRLVYSDYEPITYPQVHGSSRNMSVLDYVFNCGFELPRGWTRDV